MVIWLPKTSEWGLALRVPSRPFPAMFAYPGTYRRRVHAIRQAERILATLRRTGMAVDLDIEWWPEGISEGGDA